MATVFAAEASGVDAGDEPDDRNSASQRNGSTCSESTSTSTSVRPPLAVMYSLWNHPLAP
jgi:hypothetical protein